MKKDKVGKRAVPDIETYSILVWRCRVEKGQAKVFIERNEECVRALQHVDEEHTEKEALSYVCCSLLWYESIYDIHLCHSRKGKTIEMVNRSVVARSWEWEGLCKWSTRDFLGHWNYCVRVDTWYNALVKKNFVAERMNLNVHKLKKMIYEVKGSQKICRLWKGTLTALQMYKTTFLNEVGAKGVDLNCFGNGVTHCSETDTRLPGRNGFTFGNNYVCVCVCVWTEQLSK